MPLFFWFDLSLEARAEISEIFSLLFWDQRLFHKDILKSSDLYLIYMIGKYGPISSGFTNYLLLPVHHLIFTTFSPLRGWKKKSGSLLRKYFSAESRFNLLVEFIWFPSSKQPLNLLTQLCFKIGTVCWVQTAGQVYKKSFYKGFIV